MKTVLKRFLLRRLGTYPRSKRIKLLQVLDDLEAKPYLAPL